MNMKNILVFIMILCATNSSAQFSRLNPELFASQIHLVDEFMDRFNERTARQNLQEEYANDPKANILLLFNLAMFKSKKDSLFLKAERFAETVITDSVKLHYEDTTWYAKALCRGTLQKKKVDFVLYLKVEKNEIGRYTWVIQKAEGSIFDLSSKRNHKRFFLMPDDHETNFMSLYRVTDETADYITDYMSTNYTIDPTTVFLTWIKAGELKIEYVEDLQFVFDQVPGYQFTIRYANRENMNAGWLIDSFVEDENMMQKRKAQDVILAFASNLNAWCKTKDIALYSEAIKGLCSDGFRVNDEIVRNWVKQRNMQELTHYDLNDYEKCLEYLITNGYSISLKNIREEKKQSGDSSYLFSGDLVVESTDSYKCLKVCFKVRNNRITYIADFQ